MPAPGTRKYFIGLVPPEPVYGQALTWKEYFFEHYQSKGALRSPPHITLHMPFEWPEKKESVLLELLNQFATAQQTGFVQLKGFGCFAPRVIYLHAAPGEWLLKLQRELQIFCRQKLGLFNGHYRDLPFHPHLTVAFRDLKKARFGQAWEDVRNQPFDATFVCNQLALLRYEHNEWKVFRSFELGAVAQ